MRRGAPIYAEVLGWGQASDGYNVVIPEPNGDGLRRAMEGALLDANLRPDDIDYINAHATSTVAGDLSECHALRQVFGGDHQPWVSSTKSLTGHGLSLAGALEATICCIALQERFTPVSANITELDPACADIRIVTQPVTDAPRIALTNSSGFGGTNVCIAMQRWDGA